MRVRRSLDKFRSGIVDDKHDLPGFFQDLVDQKRGLFTKSDRKFLIFNEEDDRSRRFEIRHRIKRTIKDFTIAAAFQPKEERKAIFESLYEENENYLKYLGAYIYMGCMDAGVEKREFLVEVIEEAESHQGNDVDVSIQSTVGPGKDKTVTIEVIREDDGSVMPAGAD